MGMIRNTLQQHKTSMLICEGIFVFALVENGHFATGLCD